MIAAAIAVLIGVTNNRPPFRCIYCASSTPPRKREHVVSQNLGRFEQNWTLDCVCDACNEFFADNLELILGRDSKEALTRIDMGLKAPAEAARQLLNQRLRMTIQDPGAFDGARVFLQPSASDDDAMPVPGPQVGFRRQGGEWISLTERELTTANLSQFADGPIEVRIMGVGPDLDRLRDRLASLGMPIVETSRRTNLPITEQNRLSVVHDISVDAIVIRAACKIGFNYAAKVLGCEVVRHARFDAARRFVRYGEAPVKIASVKEFSVLTGPGSAQARAHACALGWDRGYLVVLVSLFNDVTYSMRLCEAAEDEFPAAQHLFDPISKQISAIPLGG